MRFFKRGNERDHGRPPEPAGECFRCGHQILEGEPFWSLTLSHEVMERSAITTLDAEQVSMLCADCGGGQPTIDDFLQKPEQRHLAMV